MVEISRTRPQGSVYRSGERNNTAKGQGRKAGLGWETVTEDLRQLGEKLLGETSGNMNQGKETWWWNDGVQESIQTKKLAKRTLDKDNNEENKAAYKIATKERSYRQSKGLRSPVCRHGYHRRPEESIEDGETEGK